MNTFTLACLDPWAFFGGWDGSTPRWVNGIENAAAATPADFRRLTRVYGAAVYIYTYPA